MIKEKFVFKEMILPLIAFIMVIFSFIDVASSNIKEKRMLQEYNKSEAILDFNISNFDTACIGCSWDYLEKDI